LNTTKIEWVRNIDGSQGYTLNPVKGKCPVACSYCYARRLYDRFKWNPEIRMDFYLMPEQVCPIINHSRMFVGSTIELFGDWIKKDWLEHIFDMARYFKQHTFIFLTKQPQNLIKWSPFPENCWVGVSVTNRKQLQDLSKYFDSPVGGGGIRAKVKFISIEPLLEPIVCHHEWIDISHKPNIRSRVMPINVCSKCGKSMNWQDNTGFIGINGKPMFQWVIIGQQTPVKKATTPKVEWIREIVEACDKAGIPVFLKDNLKPLFPIPYINQMWGKDKLRQEFPNIK